MIEVPEHCLPGPIGVAAFEGRHNDLMIFNNLFYKARNLETSASAGMSQMNENQGLATIIDEENVLNYNRQNCQMVKPFDWLCADIP